MTDPYRAPAPVATASPEAVAALGDVVRAHQAAGQRTSVAVATPFVVLLAYLVWLGQRGELSRWFNSTFSATTTALLLLLATGFIVRASAGADVVRLHEHGLVDLRGRVRAFRWDELAAITAQWSPAERRVVRHLVRTTSGEVVRLGRSIAGVDELVESLRAHIVEQDMPAFRARIAQGDLVRFGPVAASEAGLDVDGATIPWDTVGSVEADDGEIVVKGRGGDRLAAARLDQVPNAFLLSALARNRRG